MPNTFTLHTKNIALEENHLEVVLVRAFLARFGYTSPSQSAACLSTRLDDDLSSKLAKYQQRHGLTITGLIDGATVHHMGKPRCGNPDFNQDFRLFQRCAIVRSGYQFAEQDLELSYAFAQGMGDLPVEVERKAIRNALDTWSAAARITFREVQIDEAPILTFSSHAVAQTEQSRNCFDGVGQAIAHSVLSELHGEACGSECHLNEQEHWAVNRDPFALDVETVVLHQIGHLLGLRHSDIPGTVMFPTYTGVRRTLTKHEIADIQALYGARDPVHAAAPAALLAAV